MWQKGSNGSGGGGGNANIVDRGTAQTYVTFGQASQTVNVPFSQELPQVPTVWCNGQNQFFYGTAYNITKTGFTMRFYQVQNAQSLLVKVDWVAVIEE